MRRVRLNTAQSGSRPLLAVGTRPVPHLHRLNRPVPSGGNAPLLTSICIAGTQGSRGQSVPETPAAPSQPDGAGGTNTGITYVDVLGKGVGEENNGERASCLEDREDWTPLEDSSKDKPHDVVCHELWKGP